MLWILNLIAAISVLEALDYFFLRKSEGFLKILGLGFVIIVSPLLPFLAPEIPILRFAIAMFSFNKIIKSIEISFNRVKDPKMLESYFRYLFWSLNFPDTSWPLDSEESKNNRKEGFLRLVRGFIKLLVIGALIFVGFKFRWISNQYPFSIVWFMLVAYFSFSGLYDFISGFSMQSGIYFAEMFNSPLTSRSPREFWGKRWNLYFRDVAHRNVFIPIGGSKRPVIAVALVFFISALMHEFLIFASTGG